MAVDIRDLLVLSTIAGVGPARLRALVSHFKDSGAIADASGRELLAVEGIEKKVALSIANFFRDSGPSSQRKFVDQQLSRLNKVDGRAITFWDKEYPTNLKRIYDPPPFLFIRGEFAEEDDYSIAIVGTRSPSPYGVKMAERFATGLSKLGIPIISGLARGIDTEAHTATLRARGRTLAVIGSGIDVIYPPENKHLFERIVGSGVIVSEFLMGAKPDARNFPQRNRIISGIALGTIVVETGIEGGAMITASTALDQNRAIFAIPSAVDGKQKSGTNLLIKEGKAALLETTEDLLTELKPQLKRLLPRETHSKREPAVELTLFEQRVYDLFTDDPLHIDVLAERAHLPTSEALVLLLSMEFKGIVRQLRGKMFVKT